jgi:hypothetical protein
MHARRHQTLSAIIKTMQIDEVLKFVYANAYVKHRRLAYGKIVDACPDLFDMDCSPFVLAQAVLCVVGFPARMTFAVDCLGPPPEDQVYHLVEKLMSDELMPFAKSKMPLMICPRRRSLYQEHKGVAPSERRVMLSCKSEMASAIGGSQSCQSIWERIGDIIGPTEDFDAGVETAHSRSL